MLQARSNEFSDLFDMLADCYHSRLMLSMTCKSLHESVNVGFPSLFDDSWKWLLSDDCNHKSCKSARNINQLLTNFTGLAANVSWRLAYAIVYALTEYENDFYYDSNVFGGASEFSFMNRMDDLELLDICRNPNLFWWLCFLRVIDMNTITCNGYITRKHKAIEVYDENIIPSSVVANIIKTTYSHTRGEYFLVRGVVLPLHVYKDYEIELDNCDCIEMGFMTRLKRDPLNTLNTGIITDMFSVSKCLGDLISRIFDEMDIDKVKHPQAYALYLDYIEKYEFLA